MRLFFIMATADLNYLDLIVNGGKMGNKLNDRTVAVMLSNEIGYERIAMACLAVRLNASRLEDRGR